MRSLWMSCLLVNGRQSRPLMPRHRRRGFPVTSAIRAFRRSEIGLVLSFRQRRRYGIRRRVPRGRMESSILDSVAAFSTPGSNADSRLLAVRRRGNAS